MIMIVIIIIAIVEMIATITTVMIITILIMVIIFLTLFVPSASILALRTMEHVTNCENTRTAMFFCINTFPPSVLTND